MKKTLSLLSLALAVGLFFVGCTQPTNTTTTTTSGTTTGGTTTGGTTTTTSSYTVGSVTSAVLAKNQTYNNQAVIEWLSSDNTKVFQSGESLTINITATASAAAGELKAFLVDNSSGATNWWTELSSYANSGTNISTASTTYTFTFTGTNAASSADPAACKLALYFEPVQDDSVTLTISSITVQ